MIADYFKRKDLDNVMAVSPDLGGLTRTRELADRLGAPLGIVDKRRPAPNAVEVMNIIGDVEGRTVVMVDDLVDTAGTMVKAAEVLLSRGARAVYAAATHGVLSGPAMGRLCESSLEEFVVTNTIPLRLQAGAGPPDRALGGADAWRGHQPDSPGSVRQQDVCLAWGGGGGRSGGVATACWFDNPH